MKAYEKFDFLMKITDTPNTAIGKHLSFDSSYISRIRNGKRNLPVQEEFVDSVADFFSDHITKDYQKKALSELICPGNVWPENRIMVKKLLLAWLCETENINTSSIGNIISGIASTKQTTVQFVDSPTLKDEKPEKAEFFFGNQGKREAVTKFLSDVADMDNPPQLLLYSNEEFDWMYENPDFAKQWAMLLFKYIKKGGKIKIAHTISRASGEMLIALQKWIPIYKSGAIEPYYYPKILDRVFRKSLFIAQGHSAIVSSSVGEQTEGAINSLIRDPGAVKALEKEYWNFFEQCKPLMKIFNVSLRDKFIETLKTFNDESENLITVRSTPSFYTMTPEIAKSMTKRLNNNWVIRRQEISEKAFYDLINGGYMLTEILNLPSVDKVKSGGIEFPMCDLFDKPGLYYTKEEFISHLESVIEKLEKYDNYNVILSSAIPENELVYTKEDFGVILVKYDYPAIAFAINEQRMVSAFWDYLKQIESTSAKKSHVIDNLKDYIAKLN